MLPAACSPNENNQSHRRSRGSGLDAAWELDEHQDHADRGARIPDRDLERRQVALGELRTTEADLQLERRLALRDHLRLGRDKIEVDRARYLPGAFLQPPLETPCKSHELAPVEGALSSN